MPLLLRHELAGCLVTVDALNTQKDIAREIKATKSVKEAGVANSSAPPSAMTFVSTSCA